MLVILHQTQEQDQDKIYGSTQDSMEDANVCMSNELNKSWGDLSNKANKLELNIQMQVFCSGWPTYYNDFYNNSPSLFICCKLSIWIWKVVNTNRMSMVARNTHIG